MYCLESYRMHSVQSWEDLEDTSVEGNQATTKLILDADTAAAVVLLEPQTHVSAGRYFSKCIKHGSAIEGQIHSKSRKSWKTRQNWKRVFLHVLPRIIHSPFITKLARSPCSLFNWRFNWNDSGVRRLSPAIVENAQRPLFEAIPRTAPLKLAILTHFWGRVAGVLIQWWLLGGDCESMAGWDESLPVDLIIHCCLIQVSRAGSCAKNLWYAVLSTKLQFSSTRSVIYVCIAREAVGYSAHSVHPPESPWSSLEGRASEEFWSYCIFCTLVQAMIDLI